MSFVGVWNAEEPRGITGDDARTSPVGSCERGILHGSHRQTRDELVRLRSAPPRSRCGTSLTMTAVVKAQWTLRAD